MSAAETRRAPTRSGTTGRPSAEDRRASPSPRHDQLGDTLHGEARAVIQIGIVIGGADGNFDPQERAVVREACFALGINPAEFDL